MQRGIERAVLHLQEFIRSPLNVLSNLVTVSRPIEKRPQDEHVKRALKKPGALLFWIRHGRQSTSDGYDGRRPTIDCQRWKIFPQGGESDPSDNVLPFLNAIAALRSSEAFL